jgi:cell shape-determining protein MreC
MTQNETVERLKRENEALKKKLREEEQKRAEETAMAMIWGRSRTRGMRMEIGAESAMGEWGF